MTEKQRIVFEIANEPPARDAKRIDLRMTRADHDRLRDAVADKLGEDMGREIALYLRGLQLSDLLNRGIWPEVKFEGAKGRPRGSKLNEEGALRLMDFISENEGISGAETLAKRIVALAPDLLKGSGTSTAHVKRLAAAWKARNAKKK